MYFIFKKYFFREFRLIYFLGLDTFEILVVTVTKLWVRGGAEVDTTNGRWQPSGPPCGHRSRVSGSLQRCWRTCFRDQCAGSKTLRFQSGPCHRLHRQMAVPTESANEGAW